MNHLYTKLLRLLVALSLGIGTLSAQSTGNQTDDLSPIFPGIGLPFRVVIEKAPFQLPAGVHSGVLGEYKGLWVLIAGRMNGMHGFGSDPFPANAQNTTIYVVNPANGLVFSRSLLDPSAGLTLQQIETLSVTSPQGYQDGNTLYMTGGYGFDTAFGSFTTKPVLTAIYLPGIVDWVTQPGNPAFSVSQNIRQIYHPIFQITGGKMFKQGNMTQLIFGQNFAGVYDPNDNGSYSEQVRQFQIKDFYGQLYVDIYPATPIFPDVNFRRRDLNIMPVLWHNQSQLEYGLVAYSGVFTPTDGAWTVPVVINQMGIPFMADPVWPLTFKQGMNNYACATAGLYSKKYQNMYNVFFGGISYGFFDNGVFHTDSELPFINQITTIQMDRNGLFSQYIMDSEYPVILSTEANPGNRLLFGAGAYYVNANNVQQYVNGVVNLDNIRKPTVIGYIIGGIQSTVANTSTIDDSSASPYIFTVTLIPR